MSMIISTSKKYIECEYRIYTVYVHRAVNRQPWFPPGGLAEQDGHTKEASRCLDQSVWNMSEVRSRAELGSRASGLVLKHTWS